MKKFVLVASFVVAGLVAAARPAAAQSWTGTTYDVGNLSTSTWRYTPPPDYRSTYRTEPTYPTTVQQDSYRFGNLQTDTFTIRRGLESQRVNCSTYSFGSITTTNCR